MVFQDPYASLNPSKNIGFILGEPLRYATYLDENQKECKYSKEQIEKRVYETLNEIGLPKEYYNRFPDELSGGQQQRVALARRLAQNPQIILADEPVAALDPVTAEQVLDDFVRINETMNISILINIHHVDLALKYANRVVGIKDGIIVFDGPTADVDHDVLHAVYGRSLREDEVMGSLKDVAN